MPDFYLTNRGECTRPGNFVIELEKTVHEIGLDKEGRPKFISYFFKDKPDGETDVYRSRDYPPSMFKKFGWVICNAARDYSDVNFILATDRELKERMRQIFYQYAMEGIDGELLGAQD